MLVDIPYAIAPRGLGTSFTESEIPPDFALKYTNRYTNAAGGAEKRRGMEQFGVTVTGLPTLDAIHELVKADGTAQILVSGEGNIWRDDTSLWTLVKSGLDATNPLQSVQMGEKLIFSNGVDRQIFTKDGSTFTELKAIIERGEADTGTDKNSIHESDITNWVTDTNVSINDLVFNASVSAFAIITAVATASATHTDISASAPSAIGTASRDQAVGDRYEIIDLVELNVIPTDGEDDNAATLASGSTDNIVKVSAVSDWTETDAKVGDWVRNTTRAALGQITNVSAAAVHVTGVSGQTANDSVLFFKSAMPIATRQHVHFGRLYSIDARDRRLIRISGPNNPEDHTTDAGTLDSTSFKFGELQPQGDFAVDMASFQRFFVVTGKKNVYLFQGTDPIVDTSGGSTDFSIIGLFPQGTIAPNAVIPIGNDLVFASPDGLQALSLVEDSSTLGRANLSEAIKVKVRRLFETTPESDIFAWHYPRRSWFCIKIGSEIRVFNYTAFFGIDQLGLAARSGGELTTRSGSWSTFNGKFARQKAFLVRQNGDLLCCGSEGKVFKFDADVYDDDGEVFRTEYQTGWLTLDEPRRRVHIKQGHYIKPIIDTGAVVTYTVQVEAGFDRESTDTITINTSGASNPIGLAVVGTSPIGGSPIQNNKHPLRWRGEQARFSFTTEDNKGPDTLSRYTIYGTAGGKR